MDDFGDWVTSTGPRLIRFSYLVSGDQRVAEDLAEEAMVRVCHRWRRLAHGGNPDVYARAIVVSQLRSWKRKRSPAGAATDAHPVLPAEVTPLSDDDEGGDVADWMTLWSLTLRLPEKLRAAVVLRFYEDLDDDAIGQVLGCSPTIVPVHIRRALDRLRSHPAVGDLATSATSS
jgi:RNA polymerase sigma factor (sigma-70 family)